MNILNRLEQKFGRYAIHNLMKYIITANALVFVMDKLTSVEVLYLLNFNANAILQGQVWRLVTFLMIPPATNPIFILFALYFYYMIGNALESNWGSFKFNAYYFLGVILLIIGGFIFNIPVSVTYLNMTLFFAFATFYPNFEVRIYFILPIKVKYMAYFSAALLAFQLLIGTWPTRISIIIGVANYLIFFGPSFLKSRQYRVKQQVRQQQYQSGVSRAKTHQHECEECHITDVDDPNMEFRYCSTCVGYHEYCMDHIKNHVHHTEE